MVPHLGRAQEADKVGWYLAVSRGAASAAARIAALEVKAGQLVVTVVIKLTLALLAEGEGISLVASGTPAGGGLACRNALSISTAGAGVARVGLLLAPGDRVWHRDESRQALAHRVSVSVDITASVRAAGRGIARVRTRGAHLDLDTAGDGVGLG